MEETKYLYGASGHCKVIIDVLKSNNVNLKAIFDDKPKEAEIVGIPVINASKINDINNGQFIVSIGDNEIRKRIAEKIKMSFFTAIHSTAVVSENSKIEEGTVVMAGAIINFGAVVGKHCIINTGAIVEHDCKIYDYVHISPKAALAGNVTIGSGTHIGIGASIIQGINVGAGVTIGAGCVVINDVPDYAVVVGNPGNIIKYNSLI
ncbi:acetyltransferase [Flavobacterium ginsenosidimutans]|uniref:Acetyltransferase n=1 Tax=Flavobacterium ginsenosidimutans TaxID=687844 RepID=A0ABZ2QFH8_9FLAO|nr:acetyltransferase [Flavobacterium ginsenosidimutans]KAF2334167.1 acetyltransferase [Flavobacterium ginsenosidimutans]